ncbi:MAG TPA: hypothetical protein VK674_03400 [Candidatus Limnocylindria bacterium]|nr:hypothetical protein [Candidatus Limnocylindria bacterium]
MNLTKVPMIVWLGIRFTNRTFFDNIPNETSIQQIREVLDG